MKKIITLSFLIACWFSTKSLACDDVITRYPIVLVHGMFGFGENPSMLIRYWGDIPDMLRECGATVYVASVSQANRIEARGEQLYLQLRLWGHEKYNIIGHSHGGLDGRYVLENYPDEVASLTTIGTPHRGSKVADAIWGDLRDHSAARSIVGALGNLLGHTIGLLSGSHHRQNAMLAVQGLTTEALSGFNQAYTAGMGEDYCEEGPHAFQDKKLYSWGSYGINPTSPFDIIAHILRRMSRAFGDEANDGLVSVCSMKFGHWLGAVADAHHLIQVGGVITDIPDELEGWAESMFLVHAVRLAKEGL